jgi:transposase
VNIRYRVTLTTDERQQLQALVNGGKGAVRKIKRAQILLAADAKSKSTDETIARNVGSSTSTVYRTKQRFVEEGLEQALSEAPRSGSARKLSVNDEALLVAVACSSPPSGRARWTLELLAGEMVRLTAHKTLSGDTVGRRLAEMELKPSQEKMWCIPNINGEYVARMEDVLDLYAEEPDPMRPVVCFDETPRQLIGEERVPIRAEPGKPDGSTTSTYVMALRTSRRQPGPSCADAPTTAMPRTATRVRWRFIGAPVARVYRVRQPPTTTCCIPVAPARSCQQLSPRRRPAIPTAGTRRTDRCSAARPPDGAHAGFDSSICSAAGPDC